MLRHLQIKQNSAGSGDAQRQALWTDEPVIRIAVGPGDGEDRGAWEETFRWEGVPGEKKRIACYTNRKEAELFLNGRSLGKQSLSGAGRRAVWITEYEPGELRACASGAENTLATPGPAVRLCVRAHRASLPADGMQVMQIEAELLDSRGNPATDEIIHCQILGDLTLLGLENGRADDLTAYREPFRLTREGTLTAYVRADRTPGSAAVHFRTDSGLHAALKIRLVPVPCP